jgi:hypothetical protein
VVRIKKMIKNEMAFTTLRRIAYHEPESKKNTALQTSLKGGF